MVQKRRKLFEEPFGFGEGVLASFLLVAFGFVVEFLSGGKGIVVPGWPLNLAIIVILALIIFLVGFGLRQHALVVWLGGIPLGLSLIAALCILSMIGGIVPQDPEAGSPLVGSLGINRVFASWPFAVVSLMFLSNLGLGFVLKLVPFRMANLQFMFFHGGFWIAMTCGLLGSSDLQRLAIPLHEGRESKKGYDRTTDSMVELPFSIYLHDFEIEEYMPMLALYDARCGRFVRNASRAVLEIREGMRASWQDMEVEVVETLPYGVMGSTETPVVADTVSGVPFAKVRAVYEGAEHTGWINAGGPHVEPGYLVVGEFMLVMLPGSPKRFTSYVMFKHKNGDKEVAELEVNKPFNFSGWKIYQAGYDEKAGRWSTLSVVEAVKDPWLPAVYFGFFIIMAGNLMFFWQGMKRASKK